MKLNIFSRLDDLAISDLVEQMFLVPTSQNMKIITEGDSGEMFYVVHDGTFNVTIDQNNSMSTPSLADTKEDDQLSSISSISSVVLCDQLVRGQVFGEGAMLNATRMATVTCAHDSLCSGSSSSSSSDGDGGDDGDGGGILYGLHRNSYQKVIKKYEQRVKKERLTLLKNIPLFTQGKFC